MNHASRIAPIEPAGRRVPSTAKEGHDGYQPDSVCDPASEHQYLRALACIIVVVHHVKAQIAGLSTAVVDYSVGQAGVDIFFVISGLIIHRTSRHDDVWAFLKRRFVRIAPLYWVITFVVFILATRGSFAYFSDQLPNVLKSVLFIPFRNPLHRNEIWPYLVPGWTLNFEVVFYLLFAIGLMLGIPSIFAGCIIIGAVALGVVFTPSGVVGITYTDPIMMEFIAGMIIGRFEHLLRPAVLQILFPLGIAAMALSPLLNAPRMVSWGLPAAAIVLGLITIEKRGNLATSEWITKIGNASYSIYLCQGIAIAVGLIVNRLVPNIGPVVIPVRVAIPVAVAVGAGLLVHAVVERPLLK